MKVNHLEFRRRIINESSNQNVDVDVVVWLVHVNVIMHNPDSVAES